MMTEKFGGVHVRGVGNFVCAGTRDLRDLVALTLTQNA